MSNGQALSLAGRQTSSAAMYAVTIKSPDEVKQPYDYYNITATIAAEDVWRPASESACPLLKSQ